MHTFRRAAVVVLTVLATVLVTGLVAAPGQADAGIRAGPAPAQRGRLPRRPGRRPHGHLDPGRPGPLPGREPPRPDRLAGPRHPHPAVRRPAGPLRPAAGRAQRQRPPGGDEPAAELPLAGRRERPGGGAGPRRGQPARAPGRQLPGRLEVRAGRRRSATTATPADGSGCTTSRGSRRAASASTRSRSTAPPAPRSTPTTCSARTCASRTAASGSAGATADRVLVFVSAGTRVVVVR